MVLCPQTFCFKRSFFLKKIRFKAANKKMYMYSSKQNLYDSYEPPAYE